MLDALDIICKTISQTTAPNQIEAAKFPVDGIAGDFNGDMVPDDAVANQGSHNVSVYLGNADGTFGDPTEYPTGTSPEHIEAGDFDNDDKTDLVTANSGDFITGDVSLLLGNGDGSFQAPLSIPMGTKPRDVAVGDFNGDGNLDLATTDLNSPQVVVRLGNGDGTFQSATMPAIPEGAWTILADDLNLDDHLDIVTDGTVLLGNGDGTFQPAIDFAAGLGANPVLVRSGDLDGDGKPDVVAASGGSNIISVLLGNGDGTLQTPIHYVTGNSPTEVSVVDLDADDVLDLLVSNTGDDHLSLFFGNGDGTFQGLRTYPTVPGLELQTGWGASDATVADFTADGLPDVVVANNVFSSSWSTAVLFPGMGTGELGTPLDVPALEASARVVAGDWNADLKQDVAFTGTYPGGGPPTNDRLSILLGNDDGTFAAPTIIYLPDDDGKEDFLAKAFVNADAAPDLLVANSGTGDVSVFLGDGTGGFTAAPVVPIGTYPDGIATGDLNGDGKLDLAVSYQGDFGALNGGVKVTLGNGDGTFQTPLSARDAITGDSVVIADFDLDSKMDLALAAEVSPFVDDAEVLLGNGDGTFAAQVPLGLDDYYVHAIRTADIDQDGIPDLGVSLSVTKAAVLLGKGDGSFATPEIGDAGGTLVLADLNLDSLPDLVSPSGSGLVAAGLNVPQAPVGTADLSLTKTDSPDPVVVGADLTYTLTLTNAGPDPATGVTVTDTLPASVTFVSATPQQGSCGQAGGVVTCDLGTLDSGGGTSVALVVTPTMAGAISNTAEVVANENDPNTADNSDTASTTVTGPAQVDFVGVYRPSTVHFYLDANGSGIWDQGDRESGAFGIPGAKPVVGDWNGDRYDQIGIYATIGGSGRFVLDLNGNGAWDPGVDKVLAWGAGPGSGFEPVAGDWNGDGTDEIGIYQAGTGRWYLDLNGDGAWSGGTDIVAEFGCPDCGPVVGDWNGDGRTYIGVYNKASGSFLLDSNRNLRWDPGEDRRIAFGGGPQFTGVVGDWNGDGIDDSGVFHIPTGTFRLDANGDGVWNPSEDTLAPFGEAGDIPVAGRWAH